MAWSSYSSIYRFLGVEIKILARRNRNGEQYAESPYTYDASILSYAYRLEETKTWALFKSWQSDATLSVCILKVQQRFTSTRILCGP